MAANTRDLRRQKRNGAVSCRKRATGFYGFGTTRCGRTSKACREDCRRLAPVPPPPTPPPSRQGCPGKIERPILVAKIAPNNPLFYPLPPAVRAGGRGQGEGGGRAGFPTSPSRPHGSSPWAEGSRATGPSLSPLDGGEGPLSRSMRLLWVSQTTRAQPRSIPRTALRPRRGWDSSADLVTFKVQFSSSNDKRLALPPAAVVSVDTVRSVAKRWR